MDAYVPFPVFLVAKAFGAHFTLEVLLDDPLAMALQMRDQVALFGERLRAQLAPVLVLDAL